MVKGVSGMSEYIEVVLRSFTAFGILLIGTRILGQQLISQMTTFDFIASISIGTIAANLTFNTPIKAYNFLMAYAIFIIVTVIIAVISLKNRQARKFFAGTPTVIIQNGQILEDNMRKIRYTLDYLNQQLREKDIFNIDEVLQAMIETNGTLTVLKKPEYRSVTRQDLMIPVKQENSLPIELIMDGTLIEENLKQNNITLEWIQKELERRRLNIQDVVYAVLSPNGKIYMDSYKDNMQ
jgi:uncharacterized membrane protein YcaP (DUF421 family)